MTCPEPSQLGHDPDMIPECSCCGIETWELEAIDDENAICVDCAEVNAKPCKQCKNGWARDENTICEDCEQVNFETWCDNRREELREERPARLKQWAEEEAMEREACRGE